MKSRVLFPALLAAVFLAGCTATAPRVETAPPSVAAAAGLPVDFTNPPPALVVAGWANAYGWRLAPGEVERWSASYPTTGSPVAQFVWEYRVRRIVEVDPVPTAEAAGLLAYADFYTDPRDTLAQARVAGVDSLGRIGPWSRWGESEADTLALPVCPY